MSRFKQCARVAHAKLSLFFPSISLGQTQQLLAAALGHNTYASFKAEDLHAFDHTAAYAVLVPERAMLRALDFKGIELKQEHWWLLLDEINAKRVVGDLHLCLYLAHAYLNDLYVFQYSEDERIDDLMRRHGLQEHQRQQGSHERCEELRHVDDGGTLPPELKCRLYGEVCGYRSHKEFDGMAVPVRVGFRMERVGRRLLAAQQMVEVEQHGEPRPWHEWENEDEGGMTFDGYE